MSYFILFLAALGAATLLPLSSELALIAVLSQPHSAVAVWLVATLGNVLGAIVNWGLGAYFLRFESYQWFPFKQNKLQRVQRWFQRYGVWSLLLSWLPIVGDGLTFVAGVMRVRFLIFLMLVFISKGARYLLVMQLYYGLI